MLGFKSVKAALLISMLGFIGAVTSTQASAACSFVSTKNGSPLPIKATATDTPQAKEFLETCINPYTKAYAADPTLITQKSPKGGKALFGYNGCSGCHGGKLEGIMAPSLSKNTAGGCARIHCPAQHPAGRPGRVRPPQASRSGAAPLGPWRR